MRSSRRRSIRVLIGLAVALGAVALPQAASAASAHLDLGYDIDSPVSPPGANMLDVYLPDGASASDSRPVVLYVHGGGWRQGDKRHQIANKIEFFTGSGYVFVSANYRLSPENVNTLDPNRVMFPDHPHDVGEAIGWIDRRISEYGGDPERIGLIGHSAGAHLVSLVSADPSWIEAYGVEPWQLIGTVSLDTAAFDVAARIGELGTAGQSLYFNAFGTAAENAATGAWAAASPLAFADSGDPRFLLVTQAASGARIAENGRMASALGQDSATVLTVPLDHAGINAAVGNPADSTGETEAIAGFFADAVAAARAPRAKLAKRPPAKLRTAKRRLRVKFELTSDVPGSSFECRLDAGKLKPCGKRPKFVIDAGRHRLRYRALAPRGRPGETRKLRFRVIRTAAH